MLLFCLGIECILRPLASEGIDFVCYADDLNIDVATTQERHDEILKLMHKRFKEIGLTLNVDKCNSTLNGGKIEFMG